MGMDFASFPAYPYNTTAYKQGGAFVGCGPTAGAMTFGYFEHTFNLSGLLDNPVAGVNEGLDTAWALHGSQYMATQPDGYGSAYNIRPGLEDYAEDRGHHVKVMCHFPNWYPTDFPDFLVYGPYGDAWDIDGDFWVDLGGPLEDWNWDIDPALFCSFVDEKLAQKISVWVTIDTDGDGWGDHWVPLVGYRTSPTYQYAYYNYNILRKK